MSDNAAFCVLAVLIAVVVLAITGAIFRYESQENANENATKQLRILLGKPEPQQAEVTP